MSIPLSRPFIKRKDMDAVLTCLLSDHIGTGQEAATLTAELAGVLGVRGGLALREQPRAQALALVSLELPPGSRVALGALASWLWYDAIVAAGHVPVVLDCGERGPAIDAAALAAVHATAPVAAIVACNELGFPADIDALRDLNVPIIAEAGPLLALGRVPPGRGESDSSEEAAPEPEIPDFGDLLLVGLEQDGLVTAGGGTVLLAASAALASRLERFAAELPPEVRLPDMNASLARTQLRELFGFMERRRSLSELFRRAALRGRHRLLHADGPREAQPAGFVLAIQSSVAEVQAYARKKNVETALAFAGSVIARRGETAGLDARSCPRAFGLSLRGLAFPFYPGLSQKEVEILERVMATLP